MNNPISELLASANWAAVEEVRRQGNAALPIIRSFVKDENYRTRQIAVACAGEIEGQVSDILARGLTDPNVNVRITAANGFARRPYPEALDTLIEQVDKSPDDSVRETLVLALGLLPDERTLTVLKRLLVSGGSLVRSARLALARLGDPEARASLLADLSSPLPRARYDVLKDLIYVRDAELMGYAERLLDDREPAVRVGVVKAPRYRRVCDQAVDTLVAVLKVAVSFEVSEEKIYSHSELTEMKHLVRPPSSLR
jgi:hypothetical protein